MDLENLIKAILELDVKDQKEILKTIDSIKRIDGEIEALKQQISGKIDRKNKLIESLPEELQGFYKKPSRKTTNGTGGKGQKVKINGEIYDSLREAYYAIYPERRGKSYKFREELEKLGEKGIIQVEFL